MEIAAERFCRGAVAMTRLREADRVVPIYQPATYSDGQLWFSMKWFPERDITVYLKKHEPSDSVSVRIIEDLIGAIKSAHSALPTAIQHRDIRPGNVLVEITRDGPRAILADFDIAYYEDQLRQHEKTGVLLGNHRYLPPDVLKAGDPAEAMRRKQNDLYALSVVAFDLLVGCDRDIPNTEKEFALALWSRATPLDPLDRSALKRLANFFAQALSSNPSLRFKDVAQLESSWRTARSAGGFLGILALAIILGVLVTLGVLSDYLWHLYGEWHAARVLTQLGAMLVGVLALTLSTVSMISFLPVRFPRLWRTARSLLSGRPFLSSSAVVISWGLALSSAYLTDIARRLRTYDLTADRLCLALDQDGTAIDSYGIGMSSAIEVDRVRDLVCVGASLGGTKVSPESWFTPPLTIRQERHPVARLEQARATGPTSIATALSGPLSSVNLFGVKEDIPSPLALRWGLLRDADPIAGTSVARFGYPNGSIELFTSDGQNIGRLLVEQGYLEALQGEGGSLQEYLDAQRHAQEKRAGIWGIRAQIESDRALALCPEHCCKGTACEDKPTCEERTACSLCRDNGRGHWKLSLVSAVRTEGWTEEKVCITAGECQQTCVDLDNIDTPLAKFGCQFSSADLEWTYLEYLATNDRGLEQRLAEKKKKFAALGSRSPCKPLLYNNLTVRKNFVEPVVIGVSYEPADDMHDL